MKDLGFGTLHRLRAHGVISDLAPGGGAAFTIFSGTDVRPRGSRTAFAHECPRLCALDAVKHGLSRLFSESVAGDQIVIETAWGSQLPFLPKDMRADPEATRIRQAISDLVFALRANGIEVSFKGSVSDPDPELVRQASRALMAQRQAVPA